MCLSCCTCIVTIPKKIELGKYGDPNATYVFPSEDCVFGGLEELNLEHSAVHHSDLDALMILLQSPLRKEYRQNIRAVMYYYNILRGIVEMIVQKKFDDTVRDLYISTIVEDLQTHTFPIKIIENYGILNKAKDFITVVEKTVEKFINSYPPREEPVIFTNESLQQLNVNKSPQRTEMRLNEQHFC